MIPKNIRKTHVISAVREIDLNGIPPGRGSNKFDLVFNGKKYPPKYTLSLSNRYANGRQLRPSSFSGGQETNNFLKGLGFVIKTTSLSNHKNVTNRTEKGIKNKIKSNWLATVVLQASGRFGKSDNDDRRTTLKEVLSETLKRTNGNGVILFPGGYFNSGEREAYTVLNSDTKQLKEKLRKIERNIIVCMGVDGRVGSGYSKDQLAIAVSKKGIIAVGRKFHPTEDEKYEIHFAPTYQSLEDVSKYTYHGSRKRPNPPRVTAYIMEMDFGKEREKHYLRKWTKDPEAFERTFISDNKYAKFIKTICRS